MSLDMDSNKGKKGDAPKPVVARTPADIQRLKLEKLMKNPDKPIIIPEKPKERGAPVVPDFVRNVMGSSAGAGSGEFHVYRHLRRKEYARQHYMNEKARWEKMEDEYHQKIEDNKRKADETTAKRRAKRLKKKRNQKGKPKAGIKVKSSSSSSSSEESENESENGNEITTNAGQNIDENDISSTKNIETENTIDEDISSTNNVCGSVEREDNDNNEAVSSTCEENPAKAANPETGGNFDDSEVCDSQNGKSVIEKPENSNINDNQECDSQN